MKIFFTIYAKFDKYSAFPSVITAILLFYFTIGAFYGPSFVHHLSPVSYVTSPVSYVTYMGQFTQDRNLVQRTS